VGQGIWGGYSSGAEYGAMKEANKASIIWDGLIEIISADVLGGGMAFGGSMSESEQALRYMASEDRYQRGKLGGAFDDFLKKSSGSLRSRLVVSPSGITYVFLATPHGTSRENRLVELSGRCFAARGKILENHTVVGIGTEQYIKGKGFSLDVLVVSKPVWTREDEMAAAKLHGIDSFFTSELKCGFDEPEDGK